MKIRRMSRQEWDILPKLLFQNVCKDFSTAVGVIKLINPDKIKIAITVGTSPEWVTYETKMATKRGDAFWIHYSGSPCNNYFKKVTE